MGNIGPITKCVVGAQPSEALVETDFLPPLPPPLARRAGPGEWHDAQSKIYGRTFRYTGLGGEPRLYTTDPVAFN